MRISDWSSDVCSSDLAGNTNATELLSAEEDRYAAFHGHTIHAEESGAISDHRFNQLGGHADQGGGLRLSDGGGDRGGGRLVPSSPQEGVATRRDDRGPPHPTPFPGQWSGHRHGPFSLFFERERTPPKPPHPH